MSELDDWLNSLGVDITSNEPEQPEEVVSSGVPVYVETPEVPPEEPQTQTLTSEDFEDILASNGFTEPLYDDAEELEEDTNEEEEDSFTYDSTAAQNMDDEENAEWEERIDSGQLTTVTNPSDSGTIDATTGDVVTPPAEGILPLNSPTLLLDESTSRFSGTEWYSEIQRKSVIFAGIGGIGSNACFQLARMLPSKLVMYDMDNVETTNMSGQLYKRSDVGKSKVSTIASMISDYTNMQNVYAIKEIYDDTKEAGDIMMCGFDNMTARKSFFNSWYAHVNTLSEEEKRNCLFIDGRLSIDTIQVLCMSGDDATNIDRYRNEFLFSDFDADETICSMKQTTYLACMIGSIIVNLFTNWTANLLNPIIPYDLPFFTEYDSQNMIFKTIK